MEIWVEFSEGKWRVSPDPAVVKQGTEVLWRFRADTLAAREVMWSVYFSKNTPLTVGGPARVTDLQLLNVLTSTDKQSDGQHTGATPVVAADKPGDYKYGVRAENAESGELLGDEDPRLVVV